MSPITGLSASQMNNLRRDAVAVINRADSNADGRVSRTEANREQRVRTYTTSNDYRITDDFVRRTYTTNEELRTMKGDTFRADRNGDNQVDADELVDAFLRDADSNGDGKLGFWERTFKGSISSTFERFFTRQLSTNSEVVYSPAPSHVTPPRPNSDYDRPTPPSTGSRPTPPRPDSDYDRPKPPSASRPTPPRPDNDNDRPTPPSSSGSRPTPPRP